MKALKDWKFEIDFEGIAWATFDKARDKTNTLTQRAIGELGLLVDHADSLAKDKTIKGLIFISAKDNGFIAGADIKEFEKFTDEASVLSALNDANGILNKLEKLPIPTVAAIHGFCLGGGLELALCCKTRIAVDGDDTRIGLPEVKLGIFPGFGGTVRSIRLMGAMAAMQMMLSGRMLKARVAKRQGLIDMTVSSRHNIRWAARKAVLRPRKRKALSISKRLISWGPIRGIIANKMRAMTAKKVNTKHYPSPFALIDLWANFGDNEKRMFAQESVIFAPLMVGAVSRNLRHVFHLTELLKANAAKSDFKAKRVHVVGAGVMGGDIAAWCALSGMEVSLQDQSLDRIEPALIRAKKLFRKRLKTRQKIDSAMARLIPDVAGAHVPRADVVIEAIFEDLDAKQALFQEIEKNLKADAVMATNTSSIPIEDIAAGLKKPSRLVGIHFFNPVAQLPLVEVVKGKKSTAKDVKNACSFVGQIKKFPLEVKSAPGFLVNRVLAPYMFEAVNQLGAGQSKEVIDKAALHFGMPMGPIELCDTVGLDICMHVADMLGLKGGEELKKMVDSGKLGRKSGVGFYRWQDGKAQKGAADITGVDMAALGESLVQPLLDECTRCLKDGIVKTADEIDAGIIFGTGFAPFKGGPMKYMDSLKGDA